MEEFRNNNYLKNKMINKTISRLNQRLELADVIKIIIGFGLLLVAYEFFYLDIYNLWWPSLTIFPPVLGMAFVALGGFSLIFIFFYFKSISWKAFLPIAVSGLILLVSVYLFYPIRYLRIETEFTLKRSGFEKIIQMIETGTMQSDEYGQATLPKEYRYLSNNGKVGIYEDNNVLYVFFDTNNAIVFPRAYYIFCSNQLPPNVDIRERVYKINSYWYLVSYL